MSRVQRRASNTNLRTTVNAVGIDPLGGLRVERTLRRRMQRSAEWVPIKYKQLPGRQLAGPDEENLIRHRHFSPCYPAKVYMKQIKTQENENSKMKIKNRKK